MTTDRRTLLLQQLLSMTTAIAHYAQAEHCRALGHPEYQAACLVVWACADTADRNRIDTALATLWDTPQLQGCPRWAARISCLQVLLQQGWAGVVGYLHELDTQRVVQTLTGGTDGR